VKIRVFEYKYEFYSPHRLAWGAINVYLAFARFVARKVLEKLHARLRGADGAEQRICIFLQLNFSPSARV